MLVHFEPQPVAVAFARGPFGRCKQQGSDSLPRRLRNNRNRIEPRDRATRPEQDQSIAQDPAIPLADDQGRVRRGGESTKAPARQVVGAEGYLLEREQDVEVGRFGGAQTQLAIPGAWRHGSGDYQSPVTAR